MGCSIRGCPHNRATHTKGVKLFRIPSGRNDVSRRSAWLAALSKASACNSTRVCELHFQPSDWEKAREDGTRKLRSSAVPSQNLPSRSVEGVPFRDLTNSPQKGSVHHDKNFLLQDHSYCSSLSVPHDKNVSIEEMQFSTPYKPKQSLSCNLEISQSLSPIFSTPSDCFLNEYSGNTSSILEPQSSHSILSEEGKTSVSSAEEGLEPQLLVELPLTEVNNESFSTIMARVVALEKENQMLRARTNTIHKLNKQVCSLRRTVRTERKAKCRLQERLNLTRLNVSKFLTPDQLNAMGRKSTKGMKRTPGSISEALYFKSQCGTSAFADVAKRFCLPAPRTVQRRTQHLKFRSGILEEVFQQLGAVAPKLRNKETDCHICFDEMAIEPNDKLFDSNTKTPMGKCTLPGHSGIATKALAVMLCGVSSRWKVVVAYYFSGNRTKRTGMNTVAKGFSDILCEIISRSESLGLKVSSFSSDMGSENRALWRILGICGKRHGKINTSIPHPCNDMRRLHVLPDVPHLFKNIVQMLQSNKFIILSSEVVKNHDLPSNMVLWDHVKFLMEHEAKYELKIAYRLLEENMKRGHFEKMQVGKALAIFNHRTAAGLTLLADKENKPQYKTTAWFISLVVDWFEYATSRHRGVALSLFNKDAHAKAISHLKLASEVFQHMLIGKSQDWKPCQEGVMIASECILNLQEYYLCERGYQFLLTSRFTQDCLENLFSQIRRRHKTPHALMFKNILKEISLSGKSCRPPKGHGYDYDEGEMLLSVLLEWNGPTNSQPDTSGTPNCLDSIHCPPLTDEDVFSIIDDWEMLPLYDMAGCALHKAMETHKIPRDCACVRSLSWEGPSHHPFSAAVLERNYADGALVEVSDKCFVALVKCEVNFRILRSAVLQEQNVDVIEELCKRSVYVWENIDCPPCHGDLKSRVMKRYIVMRWKQYSHSGKKDMEQMAATYSSKSHAQKKLAKNLHLQASQQ